MIICPTCSARNTLEESTMGILGSWTQLRCRYCGAWWSPSTEELEAAAENCDDE